MNCTYTSYTPLPTEQDAQQLYQQQSSWLLQRPHDSGYVDGDEDLFAQAFKSYDPNLQLIDKWVTECQETPSLPTPPNNTSPFEYADSLILPSENWQPYDTFNANWDMTTQSYDMTTYHNETASAMAAAFAKRQQTLAEQNFCQTPESMSQSSGLHFNQMEDCQSSASPIPSRSRQREHHTAVEQRYRKNLNEQFINLRMAVPNIQTSQPQRAGQPAKPSKCEILMAAADYIKQLEEDNRRLRGLDRDDDSSRKRARTML